MLICNSYSNKINIRIIIRLVIVNDQKDRTINTQLDLNMILYFYYFAKNKNKKIYILIY